jgi:hypothetical protein
LLLFIIKCIEEQERQKNIINKISSIRNERKSEAFVIRKLGKDNDVRKQKFREHIQSVNTLKKLSVKEQEDR